MTAKNNCPPSATDCEKCTTKEDSLLCSSPEVLVEIEKARVTCRFKAGQFIFYAGNDPLGLYTIQEGLVKLETVSTTGTAHTLRLMGPGGTLGYRSLFANEAYHASAIAVKDCELCFISKADIMHVFQGHPELAMKLLSHLSKDLRSAEEKWMDQMDKGALERIAEALLFLDENFSQQHWTRKEIAQWAGTTPETVIRTLAQLEKEGLINQAGGRAIQLLQKEKLRQRSL